VATIDMVRLVHVPPKEATFMGTKWLPGSVYSAGFRMNHHKLIDPYLPVSCIYGGGEGLKASEPHFHTHGCPKES